MKTLLGDPSMTKKLLEVEKDNMSEATLRKLKKYTESPKFVPDEVSAGCEDEKGAISVIFVTDGVLVTTRILEKCFI